MTALGSARAVTITATDEALTQKMMLDSAVVWAPPPNTIVVTEDRLTLKLIEYHAKVLANRQWVAPLSMLATIGTVLCTASFHNTVLGFGGEVWNAVFILAGLGTAVWLVMAVVRQKPLPTPAQIVKEIKENQADPVPGPGTAPPSPQRADPDK